MSVGRICQRDVDLAELHESVCQAAERMHQRNVGALVVVDERQLPIGILTDRDLMVRVVATGKSTQTTQVSDVMTAYPKTIAEEGSIESALALMRGGEFRRLPVVGRDGQLVGIVTLDDILMLLSEEFFEIGRLVERETPRGMAEQMVRR